MIRRIDIFETNGQKILQVSAELEVFAYVVDGSKNMRITLHGPTENVEYMARGFRLHAPETVGEVEE